ncbi:hypothetical protein GGI43DRAFT_393364 [Trichoderma evansii]
MEGRQKRLQQQKEMNHVTYLAEPDPEGSSPVANLIIVTISNAAAMRYIVWKRSETIGPLLDFRETLTPTMQSYATHHQRHWLDWLVDTGKITTADGECLHVNERGFATAVGVDTLPVERLRLDGP